MQRKRKLLFRVGTVVVLLALAVTMYVVGRGHTIYFDNKTLEYQGVSYPAAFRADVLINGEEIAQLAKRERGMATWMGQSFAMELEITNEKGDEPTAHSFRVELPLHTDGIILNLPALVAGLNPDAYMAVFVPQVPETAPAEEEIPPVDMLDITNIEGG